MPKARLKNFHVPLPEELHRWLQAEAESADVSATRIARQAIEEWLRERRRLHRKEAIAAYARACAGTVYDLDEALEAAAVEHLLATEGRRR